VAYASGGRARRNHLPVDTGTPTAFRRDVMKASWNGRILAESEDIVVMEGNSYFPESALDRDCIVPSATTTICPWKGTAHYYTIVVDGQENHDACWFYPEPKPAASQIMGRVAFWRGVVVK
jgi:uncharacterized protein (DUF427 family)